MFRHLLDKWLLKIGGQATGQRDQLSGAAAASEISVGISVVCDLFQCDGVVVTLVAWTFSVVCGSYRFLDMVHFSCESFVLEVELLVLVTLYPMCFFSFSVLIVTYVGHKM